MNIEPAKTMTFYIERYGKEYRIVKVYPPGTQLDETMMRYIQQRVLTTNADERIVAELSVSISSRQGKIKIEGRGELVDKTVKVAEILIKEPGATT